MVLEINWKVLHKLVKEELEKGREPGHDFLHLLRVERIGKEIYQEEYSLPTKKEEDYLSLLALLHEVGDNKLSSPSSLSIDEILQKCVNFGNEKMEKEQFLLSLRNISFSCYKEEEVNTLSPFFKRIFYSISDADRLEAMGAIGIARLFCFCGSRNLPLFDEKILPRYFPSQDEYYQKKSSSGINHIFEKILYLERCLYTEIGKREGEKRIKRILSYLSDLAEETGIRFPKKFLSSLPYSMKEEDYQ